MGKASRLKGRDRRLPRRDGVAVMWLTGGMVTCQFTDSLMGLVLYDANGGGGHIVHHGGFGSLQSGPRVAEARTQLVQSFLGDEALAGCQWLLMLDDDMVFDPDLLERLMAHADAERAPIVGGLCFTGNELTGLKPTLYRVLDDKGDMERIYRYPKDSLVKVDATGAACLLIHRRVLTTMGERLGRRSDGTRNPYPWFVEGLTSGLGHAIGEDVAFCLRAGTLGFPIHVATDARLGHVKTWTLNEAKYDVQGQLATEDNPRSYVVVAVKDRHDMTADLLADLAAQTRPPDRVYICDNGSEVPARDALAGRIPDTFDLEFLWRPDLNLSQLWNLGLARASDDAGLRRHTVAVLNNDLRLDAHFLERLRGALAADGPAIVYPDWSGDHGRGGAGTLEPGECMATEGVADQGGMSGWAFMLRGELDYRFDPQFAWWCGDTDIEQRVRIDGHEVWRVGGAWCTHLDPGTSSATKDTDADVARLYAKYGIEVPAA